MTKNQVEVITSVQRRRRWPISEKERIVAAALEPGAVACEVARAAGIHVSQLFRWRQQICAPERTGRSQGTAEPDCCALHSCADVWETFSRIASARSSSSCLNEPQL